MSLPTISISTTNSIQSIEDQQFNCVLCNQKLIDGRLLDCLHSACGECLKEFLEGNRFDQFQFHSHSLSSSNHRHQHQHQHQEDKDQDQEIPTPIKLQQENQKKEDQSSPNHQHHQLNKEESKEEEEEKNKNKKIIKCPAKIDDYGSCNEQTIFDFSQQSIDQLIHTRAVDSLNNRLASAYRSIETIGNAPKILCDICKKNKIQSQSDSFIPLSSTSSNSSTSTSTSEMEEEEKMKATALCIDCDQNMCFSCFEVHSNLASTQNHSTKSLEVIRRFPMVAVKSWSSENKCEIHTNQSIDYFCHSCQQLICVQCAFDNHQQSNGHQCISIKEHQDNYKQLIEQKMEIVEELCKSNENSLDEIRKKSIKISEERQQMKMELNEQFDKLIDLIISQINWHRSQMMAQLNAISMKRLKKIGMIGEKMNELKMRLEELHDFSQRRQDSQQVIDLISSFQMINHRMKELDERLKEYDEQSTKIKDKMHLTIEYDPNLITSNISKVIMFHSDDPETQKKLLGNHHQKQHKHHHKHHNHNKQHHKHQHMDVDDDEKKMKEEKHSIESNSILNQDDKKHQHPALKGYIEEENELNDQSKYSEKERMEKELKELRKEVSRLKKSLKSTQKPSSTNENQKEEEEEDKEEEKEKMEMVKLTKSSEDVLIEKNHLSIRKMISDEHGFAIASPSINERNNIWKVIIKRMKNDIWAFVGIIHNNFPSNRSFNDFTSFGWGSNPDQVFIGGKFIGKFGEWTGWKEGDEALMYLDLNNRKLKMWHKRTSKKYEIEDLPKLSWNIQLNVHYVDDCIELSSVNQQEINFIKSLS